MSQEPVKGMSERMSNMQFEMLENNIIDMIEEQQGPFLCCGAADRGKICT